MGKVIAVWLNNEDLDVVEDFCKKYHYDHISTLMRSLTLAFIKKMEEKKNGNTRSD